MNKILSFCFLAFTFIIQAKDGFRVLKSDANSVTIEYSFAGLQKQTVEINGKNYYKLYAENCVPVLDEGFPQVLRSAVSLALPQNAEGIVELISAEFTELADHSIAPSKGSLKRNVDPSSIPYSFNSIYQQNAYYPAQPFQLGDAYQLRVQKGAALSVFPVQVNPVNNSIKIYSKLIIKIKYVNQKGTRVSLNIPSFTSKDEKNLLSDRFMNYEHLISSAKVSYTPINEFGSMLVISHPALISNVQPLVDWKNQKGIKTELISSVITGTTGASLKTYIQNYYAANPGLLYILLVGDHEQINSYNNGTAGSETKWGDTFYGFLAGTDHYPEVMVGRFSSVSATDINTMVNRTIEYEKTPLTGNWYSTGIGIGSNEGYGIGDDNEPDWLHMRNIGNKLLANGYGVYHEFYDSTHGGSDAPGDPNSTMVTNTVNAGASIFLYCGHGSQNTCVTSNFNITNINSATNYGKYPFTIQVACNNGTFIGGTCFSEAFLRAAGTGALGPKGAIASVGSSILMAWAEPMQAQDEIGDILSNQYTNNKKYTIGGLFFNGEMSMLDNYPTATGKEVMETWVMFGDPSCTFRSQNPSALIASHDPCYVPGSSGISINSSFGPMAYACVSQNNQIVGGAALTSGTTNIAFTQTYSATQPLLITISQFNKTPYTSIINNCVTTGINDQKNTVELMVESPIGEEMNVVYNNLNSKNLTLMIYDVTGKLIISSKHETTESGKLKINTADLSSGVYLVSIKDNNNVLLKTVKVIKQ